MKVPEPLFSIINPIMRLLLRSPIHGLLSDSLMLISFRGRNSGKLYTTPVRYLEADGIVRCFTASENQWWRNLREGADVVLRIRGEDCRYHAVAIENNPVEIRKQLVHYLGVFPEDAVYHEIKLNKDKSLVEADLERASHNAIVVEATPCIT